MPKKVPRTLTLHNVKLTENASVGGGLFTARSESDGLLRIHDGKFYRGYVGTWRTVGRGDCFRANAFRSNPFIESKRLYKTAKGAERGLIAMAKKLDSMKVS